MEQSVFSAPFDKKRLARFTGSTISGYMKFVHRWSRAGRSVAMIVDIPLIPPT
jgi:hypothetical protein